MSVRVFLEEIGIRFSRLSKEVCPPVWAWYHPILLGPEWNKMVKKGQILSLLVLGHLSFPPLGYWSSWPLDSGSHGSSPMVLGPSAWGWELHHQLRLELNYIYHWLSWFSGWQKADCGTCLPPQLHEPIPIRSALIYAHIYLIGFVSPKNLD